MEKKRLVLIDGHAILHRAFYALPPLTTSQDQPTGAVFGFCSMLLRIIQDLKPEFLAVAFDLPKPTFRQKLFKAYQAQRPPLDEKLISQIDLLHEVLKTMGVPIFEKEGYEADDLIGTLAFQAAKMKNDKVKFKNVEIVIVTGDRDMLQLVSPHVKVLAPVVGITQMVFYDEKKVEEKYGLKPRQWVDFKALVGDPSDNYPGVSGVGPKTATDLLRKYGTLEKVYQNLKELSEKQAQSLTQSAEKATLAQRLATIVIDAPIKLDLKKCQLQDLKNPKVKKMFQELEFKSLWERVEKDNSPEGKESAQLPLL